MSVTINGLLFPEIPICCGFCPSWTGGDWDKKGWCVFFEKQKWRYNNIPLRCKTLFEKGFQIGGGLVIVVK